MATFLQNHVYVSNFQVIMIMKSSSIAKFVLLLLIRTYIHIIHIIDMNPKLKDFSFARARLFR